MPESNEIITEEPHLENLSPGDIGQDIPPVATLPRELVRSVTWRHVRLLFALTSALVIASNIAASAYLKHYTPNLGYWLVKQKWALLEKTDMAYDWVILGDSSCNQGVDPDIWDAELNVSSLNLCTIGDMLLLDDVWMLQRLIDRGLAPRNALIVHVYDIWQREANPILLGQVPCHDNWKQGSLPILMSKRDALKEFFSRYIPLIAQNAALRSIIVKPNNWFRQQHSITSSGFMSVAAAKPETVERDTMAHLSAVRARNFTISDANLRALDELAHISDTYGITIVFAQSPVSFELGTDPYFEEHAASIKGELERRSQLSSVLKVIPDIFLYEKSEMENADHLTESAARDYTQRLAHAVGEKLPSPE